MSLRSPDRGGGNSVSESKKIISEESVLRTVIWESLLGKKKVPPARKILIKGNTPYRLLESAEKDYKGRRKAAS